jgi:two-component system, NtrC family, nitrogen regulation sensor histidine kinase NtrY
MSRFELKVVGALVLIAIIPLVASVILVGQVIKVSDSVTEGRNKRMLAPLKDAADAYRTLFAATKRGFRLEAQLIALDPDLRVAAEHQDGLRLRKRLKRLVEGVDELGRVVVRNKDAKELIRIDRSDIFPAAKYRDLVLTLPLGTGAKLEFTFYTANAPFDQFQALDRAQRLSVNIDRLRGELANSYRVAFFVMFAAVLLIATGLGIFIARRTTRRVSNLASATRRVAGGHLDIRVEPKGSDEIGVLEEAFNDMVSQLRDSQDRITYLEKIGAWQEIARRLAHEIKNPLTPIQLAIQQVHKGYKGDDDKFGRQLNDARDIITEEVDGLRRLVHAFSAFAKLPTVRPENLEFNAVVDDFIKSHGELAEKGGLQWTPMTEHCVVSVDRMMMKQLLFNLVENAVQAAEGVGQTTLVVVLTAIIDRARGSLVVELADNGPGIARETAPRVFDPYYTTKDEGTGLGLAIVKKIILEHGGTVDVESPPTGGSRFRLALPLVNKL